MKRSSPIGRKADRPDPTTGFAHPKRRPAITYSGSVATLDPAIASEALRAAAVEDRHVLADSLAALMTAPVSSLRAQPKPQPPIRCRAYLDYVALQPCCCPGCSANPAGDPHHEGPRGVGQKTDDLLVVPLCRRHHQFVEDKLHLPGLSRTDTEALFARMQIRFLVRWLRDTGVWVALQEAGLVPR